MVLLLAVALHGGAAAALPADISKERIGRWIAARSGCDAPPAVEKLVSFDFDGDGREEVVVVASTCRATSGSDVHAVLTVDHVGAVSELPVDEPPKEASSGLFGARNPTLGVEDGRLVAIYTDT